MDLDRTIDATVEPVSLLTAKKQCRVEIDSDDDLIGIYIKAAREYCEKQTDRAFLQQTWRLTLRTFPRHRLNRHSGRPWETFRLPAILLPKPKLIGIVSITYLDITGTRQTLDPSLYTFNPDAEPARVTPAPGKFWPFGTEVQVTYTAGYGNSPAAVPASISLAMLLLIGHWYENREASVLPASGTGVVSIPLGVDALLEEETFTCFTFEDPSCAPVL